MTIQVPHCLVEIVCRVHIGEGQRARGLCGRGCWALRTGCAGWGYRGCCRGNTAWVGDVDSWVTRPVSKLAPFNASIWLRTVQIIRPHLVVLLYVTIPG